MKKSIIAHMRSNAGYSAEEADKALSAVAAAITTVANSEDSARVPGFGTFKVKARAERTGRNPATGETVTIPAKRVLTFKEAKGG